MSGFELRRHLSRTYNITNTDKSVTDRCRPVHSVKFSPMTFSSPRIAPHEQRRLGQRDIHPRASRRVPTPVRRRTELTGPATARQHGGKPDDDGRGRRPGDENVSPPPPAARLPGRAAVVRRGDVAAGLRARRDRRRRAGGQLGEEATRTRQCQVNRSHTLGDEATRRE